MEEAYLQACQKQGVAPHKQVLKALVALNSQVNGAGGPVKLDFAKQYIGSKHALLLCSVIADIPFLQSISLAGNGLTEDGVAALCASAASHPTLTSIDLSSNTLPNSTATILLDLVKKNPNIVSVALDNTSIPEHAVQNIQLQLEENAAKAKDLRLRIQEDKQRKQTQEDGMPQDVWEWCSNEDDEATSAAMEEDRVDSGTHDMDAKIERPKSLDVDSSIDAFPAYRTPREALDALIASTDARFTDQEFPPEPTSLFSLLSREEATKHCQKHHIQWRRVSDLAQCASPMLLNSQDPSFIHKNSHFGTLWFVNALRVIANPSVHLAQLTIGHAHFDLGLFSFKFFKNGARVEVVVDDWVPVSVAASGSVEINSCHHASKDELWAPLIEKAYAKLHQGYDRVAKGCFATAISDLTGGLTFTTRWDLPTAKRILRSGSLVKRLETLTHRNHDVSVMTCAQCKAKGSLQQHALEAAGLEPNACYIVDKYLKTASGCSVVRLVQPNTQRCWTGRFSAESAEMTESWGELAVDPSQRHRFTCMTIEDFACFFTSLYSVVNMQLGGSLSLIQRDFCGLWSDTADGNGGVLGSPYWTENPSFYVSAPQKLTNVLIHLSQRDLRLLSDAAPTVYPTGIQLMVFRLHNTEGSGKGMTSAATGTMPRQRNLSESRDLLYASPVVYSRDVAATVTVSQADEILYVVVGCSERRAMRFHVQFASAARFSAVECIPGPCVRSEVHGTWEGALAAGSSMDGIMPPALKNPQYRLEIFEGQVITVVLTQRPWAPKMQFPIGLLIQRSASPLRSGDDIPTSGRIALTLLEVAPTIRYSFTAPTSGHYVIVPMTANAQQDGSFELVTFTTGNAVFRQISL